MEVKVTSTKFEKSCREIPIVLESYSKTFPIRGSDFAEKIGLTSSYEVRRVVNLSRKKGIPICSSDNGYWLSNNPVEIQETVQQLNNRIKGIQGAITGLETCLVA